MESWDHTTINNWNVESWDHTRINNWNVSRIEMVNKFFSPEIPNIPAGYRYLLQPMAASGQLCFLLGLLCHFYILPILDAYRLTSHFHQQFPHSLYVAINMHLSFESFSAFTCLVSCNFLS